MILRNGEELLKALEKIRDKPVVVEGKNDKKALCLFGFTKVHSLNGKDLYEFAAELKEKEAIILTDFDKEGDLIAKNLTLFLQNNGCKVATEARKKLRRLFVKNQIFKIEELKKGDVNGKVGASHHEVHDLREVRS